MTLKYFTVRNTTQLLLIGIVVVLLGMASVYAKPMYLFGGLAGLLLTLVIFRNPWHGLLLLAFFIPFERLGSYDIGGMTLRPSQVSGGLTVVSLFFHLAAKKRLPMPKNPLLIPLGLFVIVLLFGLINAPNMHRSLLVLFFTLFTICIGMAIPFLVTTQKHVERLLLFFFASYLVVTIFGLYQFFGDLIGLPQELTGLRDLYVKDVLGFPRVQSTALEPLYFANYLLVPLSILIARFINRDNVFSPLYTFGLIALGGVNLILTVARGGYIAFAVSLCIVLAYFFFEQKLITWRNVGIASGVLIMSIIVVSKLIGFQTVSEEFLGHVSHLTGGASFNERVDTIELAYQAWHEHPLIGIGPGSFGPYEAPHPYYMREPEGWRIVNNEYMELLVENGVLGLLFMSIVFLLVIIRSIKAILVTNNDYIKTILVGTLAGFLGILVQYNTFSILYIVHIWFVIGLLVALQNIAFKHSK